MKLLIIVDPQEDFIKGVLGTEQARVVVPKIKKLIRDFEGDIIVTMDTHFENYLKTLKGRKLPIPHCIKDTNGWQIDADIRDNLMYRDYIVICKETFGSIELPEHIQREYKIEDIEEIVIAGVCTDICVVVNAMLLRAYFPNTKITVEASCCAGTTPEMHEAALKVMESCQMDIVYVERDFRVKLSEVTGYDSITNYNKGIKPRYAPKSSTGRGEANCPECCRCVGHLLGDKEKVVGWFNVRCSCGQLIDWSEVKENI